MKVVVLFDVFLQITSSEIKTLQDEFFQPEAEKYIKKGKGDWSLIPFIYMYSPN